MIGSAWESCTRSGQAVFGVAVLGGDGAHPGRAEHRDDNQRRGRRAIAAARSGPTRATPMATPKPA
jgi:hypothetical protein